jgi:hypothetical protein
MKHNILLYNTINYSEKRKNKMSVAVNLDDKLVKDARRQSKVLSRSVTKQIEHWARIGHIAEDNPDMTYSQIKDLLLGLEDYNSGNIEEYKRETQ